MSDDEKTQPMPGMWWFEHGDGRITYSHDRESLVAYVNGDTRRFGPASDCYSAEGDEVFDPERKVLLA